jgi:transcriptional regulator
MYRPPRYAVDEPSALHGLIKSYPLATIAVVLNGKIEFAYAPVVLDADNGARGGVRFHLARPNPVARLADAEFYFSFRGSGAYVSPDWYRSASMVPTWNYLAVEGCGRANLLDEVQLLELLVDLSAQEEEKLAPKRPWTIDKVSADRQAVLLRAIIGFSVRFDRLEGKLKLSQEKSDADFDGARSGLEARGDPSSVTIASAMRTIKKRM